MITPPYASTYSTQSAYITVQEFVSAPSGVDVTDLVPNGSTLTNAQALSNLILRASGWADELCKQKLAATVDTRAGRFPLRQGYLAIPLPFRPVVGIESISTGWSPSTMTDLSTDLTGDVWPDANGILTVPVYGAAGIRYGVSVYGDGPMYATVRYVNGWANTALTDPVSTGATSLTVRSGLGLNAGQSIYLYSDVAGEVVTVGDGYVASTATGETIVPLTSPVSGTYAVGDTLTAMPQQIKQAVICLTSVLIKTRGAESMEMQNMHSTPMTRAITESGAGDDWQTAVDLLASFTRVGA